MSQFQATYAAMTDDQLLNIAGEADSLRPEARNALGVELAKRRMGQAQVAEYVERVGQAERILDRQRPIARTINGIGTKIYGKRCFGADDSFLTTKWVVFFWIPLIPLKSMRLKDAGRGGPTRFLPGWSRKYFVLSESSPDAQQVVSIYAFVGSALIIAALLDSMHAVPAPVYGIWAVWACTPWILRTVKKRSTESGQEAGVQRVTS